MKRIFSISLMLIPLLALSQYDVHIDNMNNYVDVRCTVYESAGGSCSSPSLTGTQAATVYNGGGVADLSSSTEIAYQVEVCVYFNGGCGNVTCTSSEDYVVLGPGTGVYSGTVLNCIDGYEPTVTWTTNVACENIDILIQ